MKATNITHNVFLNECLYKLQELEYDRIDMSEGIDVNKTNSLRECIFAINGTFSR